VEARAFGRAAFRLVARDLSWGSSLGAWRLDNCRWSTWTSSCGTSFNNTESLDANRSDNGESQSDGLKIPGATSLKVIGAKGMAKKRSAKWRPWNKGIALGQKDAFTPDQVKQIRQVLARRRVSGLRDLALFSVAIDTMLRGLELLNLTIKDVQRPDGTIRSVIEVARPGSRSSVRCALSKVSATALARWIAVSGFARDVLLFGARRRC
jgi:hypothetical protein